MYPLHQFRHNRKALPKSQLTQQIPRLRLNKITTSIALAIAISIATITATVAVAPQLRVTPSTAVLGDTIKVVIETEAGETPTVSMRDQTYRAFPIGQNRFRALLPTTPLDKPGTWELQVNPGDGQVQNLSLRVNGRTFPVQRLRIRSSASGGLRPTEYELNRVRAFRQLVTPEKYWNGPFVRPNRGRISTVYGVRRYYNGVFANDYFHRGLDYAGGMGS
ncbi:MAG TPA: peptidase, partial [Cyanobacteria bacterium UBA11368]|nr:peptidase [Cyanobacteria bacterium UBA11368]